MGSVPPDEMTRGQLYRIGYNPTKELVQALSRRHAMRRRTCNDNRKPIHHA